MDRRMVEGGRVLLNERSSQQLIDSLHRLVAQFENERSLLERNQLLQRMEALDRLDANFPDTHQLVFGAESGEGETLSPGESNLRQTSGCEL